MPAANFYTRNRNPSPGNYEIGSIFGTGKGADRRRGASIGYGHKNPF